MGISAFPSSPTLGEYNQLLTPDDIGCQGLTKREYFAAKALQGYCSNPHLNRWGLDSLANLSVRVADELIKELER